MPAVDETGPTGIASGLTGRAAAPPASGSANSPLCLGSGASDGFEGSNPRDPPVSVGRVGHVHP
jgi:hypothetical protein